MAASRRRLGAGAGTVTPALRENVIRGAVPGTGVSQLRQTFRALEDSSRRRVVTCVQEHREMTLADLAERVAEHERDVPFSEIPAEEVRDHYLSLYHHHVPLLEDARLVRYDQRRDLVSASEHARYVLRDVRDAMAPLLRACEVADTR